MKLNIIKLNFLFLLSFILLESCSNYVAEKNLSLEVQKTTTSQLKSFIDFEDDEIFPLRGKYIGTDNYKVVITNNDYLNSGDVYYFYLLKNDVLHFYGYPYQFLGHSNETIKSAGEEAVEILIKKEEIEVKQ
jgi:hypothetical protein